MILASSLGLGPAAHAVEPAIAQEAMILIKVLGYDRRLEHGELPVGVVVLNGPGSRIDQRACDDFGEGLELAASQVELHGRSVKIRRQVWVDAPTLASELAEHPTHAILVCDNLVDQAPEIAQVARAARVLTASLRRDLVESTLAVGVVRLTSRVEIVVNLATAEAEGATFGSDLLQLATVVR